MMTTGNQRYLYVFISLQWRYVFEQPNSNVGLEGDNIYSTRKASCFEHCFLLSVQHVSFEK